METTIKSIPELERFAREYLQNLPMNTTGATVVGLSGDLGSGKTAFVKAAANALNVKGAVVSPTFVIAKFYQIPRHPSWSRLVHVDAYRIEEPEELKSLHFETISADPRSLLLIEWPEHIGALFPKNSPVLSFRFIDETTRVILNS